MIYKLRTKAGAQKLLQTSLFPFTTCFSLFLKRLFFLLIAAGAGL